MVLIAQKGKKILSYLSLENILESFGFSCVSYYINGKPYSLSGSYDPKKKIRLSYTGIVPKLEWSKEGNKYKTTIYTTEGKIMASSRSIFPVAKFIAFCSSQN